MSSPINPYQLRRLAEDLESGRDQTIQDRAHWALVNLDPGVLAHLKSGSAVREFRVEQQEVLAKLVSLLVRSSCWFGVQPEPDDVWMVTVRDDRAPFVRQVLTALGATWREIGGPTS